MSLSTHRPFSIAPMMGWTHRWFRTLMRVMAPQAMLYTEMITANAVIHADHLRVFDFSTSEHPLGIQIGGGDPETLEIACRRLNKFGFQEFNLNAGCPSIRVQNANIGACLMLDKNRLIECFRAINESANVPATVKCRLGVDEYQDYDFIAGHVEGLQAAGCRKIIIHARSAWLKGLNPKQNRNIPPLDYSKVYRIKKDFPDMLVEINGGVRTIEDFIEHSKNVDSVMLGRVSYENPYFISQLSSYDGGRPSVDRCEILRAYISELNEQPITQMRPIISGLLNLFKGQPGSKRWKRALMGVKNIHGLNDVLLLAQNFN